MSKQLTDPSRNYSLSAPHKWIARRIKDAKREKKSLSKYVRDAVDFYEANKRASS